MDSEKKLAINVMGPMGSGKGMLAEFLKEHHEFSQFTFSDVIKDELRERGLDINTDNIFKVHDELRAAHGDEVIARRIVEHARKEGSPRIIFEGGRYPAQASYIKNTFPDSLLLYIDSAPEIRKARLLERKRSSDPSTEAEVDALLEKDLRISELCREVPGTIVIENNGTLDEFYEKVLAVLRSQESL
jgi:dephospho-CoA kinase